MCREVLTISAGGASLQFVGTPLCIGKDVSRVIELDRTPSTDPAIGMGSTPIVAPGMAAVVRSLVRVHQLLAGARVIWLSSVRPDGRPHVVPTWFDWDGEVITVFTRPEAQKVRNIRNHPSVMVAIGTAEQEFDVELIEGEARVIDREDGSSPAVLPSTRFATKYGAVLALEGRTVSSFAADYPCVVRIRPTRLLDWGAREHSQQHIT
jgi:PPOX class probable F420-dependent enzyme